MRSGSSDFVALIAIALGTAGSFAVLPGVRDALVPGSSPVVTKEIRIEVRTVPPRIVTSEAPFVQHVPLVRRSEISFFQDVEPRIRMFPDDGIRRQFRILSTEDGRSFRLEERSVDQDQGKRKKRKRRRHQR